MIFLSSQILFNFPFWQKRLILFDSSLPNPMNAMQILWINILMDGPPAQALGLEPADPALTTGKPRSTRQKLLNKGVVARILANATLVSLFLNSFEILGIQKLGEQ